MRDLWPFAWPMLRRLIVGAAAFVATTSLACAIAAFRRASAVEPYVWVENPLGNGPAGSLFWHLLLAALFAAAVVLSYHPSPLRGVRLAVAAALGSITLVAAKDAAVFYSLLAAGRIQSNLAFPLSLCVSLLAAGAAMCVWRPPSRRRCLSRRGQLSLATDALSCGAKMSAETGRSEARTYAYATWQHVPLDLIGGFTGACLLVLVHLVTFGSTDYSRVADVAVILGAKVYSDGTPSTSLADRLETGIELFRSQRVRYLLMTGGTGVEGCNEAWAMRDYALAAGVPQDRILVDPRGINTLISAKNCRSILSERGLESVLLVSHYFHLARCKLAFSDQGIHCTTVPARMTRRLVYEPYFVLRECVAYPAYCIERPLRCGTDQ